MSIKEKFSKRIFEIIPGLLAWSVITIPLWGGLFFPVLTAYFILTFNAYWVYKSLSSVVFFVIGYLKIRNNENTDWMQKLNDLSDIEGGVERLKREKNGLQASVFDESRFKDSKLKKLPSIFKRILYYLEKKKTLRYLTRELEELAKLKDEYFLDWKELHHVVIIPFWKEPYPVLKRNIDRLMNQNFPISQISIMIGAEARWEPAIKIARRLTKDYKGKFENVWVNNHHLKGDDIVGKAANMADCGKIVQKKIEELNWDKSKVTVTGCDSDTQFNEQYFAYLSYLFVTDDNRYTHFYAAPMMYYANIWKVPFYSRIANTLFSINNVSIAARIDKFIQVSSYSFSWKLLEDIDFWSVDVIPEDFHMFFKALFIHGDKVLAIPIYLRNLSDAAESIGHIGTIKNQYEQVKRWAWGVSDHGWMIKSLFRAKKKTFYMFYRVAHTIFDHLTWSIISFVLLFGANIPPLLNKEFAQTVLGQKLPSVSSFMMTLTTISFLLTIIMDFFLKPRRKEKISIFRFILEQFQWIAFPVVSLLFGAIPGLDAQTRLLFGNYMEYRLTEKH